MSSDNSYPGMMGDGTEEQNLNQRGNPSARITQGEVEAAFGAAAADGERALDSAAAKASATARSAKAAVASKAREVKSAVKSGASKVAAEARSFADGVEDEYGDVLDEASDRLNTIADRVSAVRDQVQQSAAEAKAWALRQADAAKQTASEKPVLVVSASAGAALAIGLAVGFIIGRATADEY